MILPDGDAENEYRIRPQWSGHHRITAALIFVCSIDSVLLLLSERQVVIYIYIYIVVRWHNNNTLGYWMNNWPTVIVNAGVLYFVKRCVIY